jgi:hypothetical protein
LLSACLQGLDELHSQYVSAAKAAADEASTAVVAAYAALTDSLAAEQQQLASFTQQQSAAAGAVYSATQSIVSSLREQLEVAKAQARFSWVVGGWVPCASIWPYALPPGSACWVGKSEVAAA